MIIQHVRTETKSTVTHFEITDEMVQNYIHTFGNFHGTKEFHDAFFDTGHEKHAEAQEILTVILRPTQIYACPPTDGSSQWVSGDDIVPSEQIMDAQPLIPMEDGGIFNALVAKG